MGVNKKTSKGRLTFLKLKVLKRNSNIRNVHIDLPRNDSTAMVQQNYLQIKQDVEDIIQSEIERVLNDPGLKHLIIKK